MVKKVIKIKRKDGVTQGYHVGQEVAPPTIMSDIPQQHNPSSTITRMAETLDDAEKKFVSKKMPTITAEQMKKIVDAVSDHYDQEQATLHNIYLTYGEGSARAASGKMYEKLVDTVVSQMEKQGLTVKKGDTDYVSTTMFHPDGEDIEQEKLQVDRHLYKNGKREGFIECKTYLDKSNLSRAVSDCLEIHDAIKYSGEPTHHLKYAIFAGQNAVADKSRKFQEARFWMNSAFKEEHRREVEIFYIHDGKRNQNNPIYKVKHPLVKSEIERFVKFLAS